MTTSTVQPMQFELRCRKLDAAPKGAPSAPRGFRTMRGTMPKIAAFADRYNDSQKSFVKPWYFFYPESIPTEPDPLHCNICKRVAIREASRED